ncbi:MAG: recombinase family protein [Candidatus Limnocylindrales bacterium]|jgi:DNA invertase Pin-like site-specific DNA recombinase
MKRLPRSLDDIGGLRAARWIRESTAGQYDRFGPASQREQQDRFIERYGLIDTGRIFQVAHSGTTVWRSPTMTEMLAEAKAGSFDLLLAGYSDRWQRNLRRTLELLEDHLHPAGVALVMYDRKILSSDPHDWDELVAESASAERYSRRLSERITEGYAAKFTQENDPGGHAALGFRRSSEPPNTLEIDPATIGHAVGLFERYALGTLSAQQLFVETGLEASRIRCILMNPIYNGWIRRHRGPNETRRPAPWRSNPPVSDELWARVEEVRRTKCRGSGPHRLGRVDMLAGLLHCVCGRRIRSDGWAADRRYRKLHPKPCQAWGTAARLPAETWEVPILAQVGGIELNDGVIAGVVAALGSTVRPIAIDRSRIERQMRELALDHVGGGMSDETYLERLKHLRACLAEVEETAQVGVPADRAVEWLRALAETWHQAEVPEARSELLHAIYERIVVAGREFVSARLTPAAYAHGLALALPEKVARARPTGVGHALTTYRIPIEGRDEWLAAARVKSA